MAVDLIMLYDCRPRWELGQGDPGAGTQAILAGVKAHSRAEAIAAAAREQGEDLDSIRIQILRNLPGFEESGGPQPVEVGYRELLADYEPLRQLEPECTNCPANVFGEPFGCSKGFINYPIPPSAEQWLVERLQPPGTVGGHLLMAAIEDFGLTGEPLIGFRRQGLFSGKAPASQTMSTPEGDRVTVRSDQILQAILCVGEPLDPGHIFGILLWLGTLLVDSETPGPEETRALLNAETDADRASATQFDVGPISQDPGIYQMQRMLFFLYRAWVTQSRVWVDA